MTSRRIILSLLVIAMVSFAAIPSPSMVHRLSQTPGQMVLLHVRVMDANGRAVADVPQSSFQVIEDGIPQQIDFFSSERVPLSYGLVIDCSGSIRQYIEKVVSASIRIVNSNTEADQTFIVRFISSDKIELVQEVTSDKNLLIKGLNGLYVEGGATAVVDAVYIAAQKLAEVKSDVTRPRRKVLVLVTDGEDRNSFYREEQLLKLLNSSDSQVYIVGLRPDAKPDKQVKAARLLNLMAGETGGRVFAPANPSDIDRIGDEIINDIRTQYVIGYVPTSSSKDFHKVEVNIADNPNQQKRIAVSRVGYRTPTK
jgi:Ca-activated chloride channel homolog